MIHPEANILVTGATGFLGSYICRQLWQDGYQNIHATRRTNSSTDLLGDLHTSITWHETDLADVLAVKDLLQKIDIVIHVAGFVSHLQKDFDKLIHANATIPSVLANVANECSVKMFLHISSIASLGRNAKKEKINEKKIWSKSEYNTGYAISKYLGEMEIWRAHAEGLPINIINPSIILGAGRWGGGSLAIFSTVHKKMPLYPVGSSGWVDVRDVAKMVVRCLESDLVGERFICSAENKSFKEIIDTIATNLNVRKPTFKVTSLIAEMAWRFYGVLSFFTGKKPVVNKSTSRMTQYDYFYHNEKSQKLLNFEYRPIRDTIQHSTAAFQKSISEKSDFAILPI